LHNAARFGDFSYGTYLYAFTIQEALLFLFGKELTFPLYVAASMAFALFAGVVSWFTVERWFLVSTPKRLSRPQISRPVSAHWTEINFGVSGGKYALGPV